MDWITRCYVAKMRLVQGDNALYDVVWRPAAPDAPVWEGNHAFLSPSSDNANNPPKITGVGEIRQRCPQLTPCNPWDCPPDPVL